MPGPAAAAPSHDRTSLPSSVHAAGAAGPGDEISVRRSASRRSVTFSETEQSREQSTERAAMAADGQDSSADETTAIVGRASDRNPTYNTSARPAAGDRTSAESRRARDGSAVEGRSTGITGGLLGGLGARKRKNGRSEGSVAGPEEGSGEGWWKRLGEKYGSVELENKGSVARDHLALERTFLAWLRTSLSFASIGIAVTQLFRLNTTIASGDPGLVAAHNKLKSVGKPLGATFIGVSIIILFIGFHRYFESQHYVIRGRFPASRGSVMIVAIITGLLIITSLVVVLAVGAKSFES